MILHRETLSRPGPHSTITNTEKGASMVDQGPGEIQDVRLLRTHHREWTDGGGTVRLIG